MAKIEIYIPTFVQVISDTEFYDAVSEEEKAYYKEKAPDPDSVEQMNIHCTACGEQVRRVEKSSRGGENNGRKIFLQIFSSDAEFM